MKIVYRLLSVIVNMFAVFCAMMLIFSFVFILASPLGLLGAFFIICIVLYAWFANRFYISVIIRKQQMTKRQKDWLQVNAIVVTIISVICIFDAITVYYNPKIIDEAIKAMPVQDPSMKQYFINSLIVVFILFSVVLIHVIWTYLLVRKNKEYFAA